MSKSTGFTVIELLFVVLLLGAASILFFVQKNNIEITARDDSRKVSINAIYYGLEEIYYKENGSYPRTVNASILPFVDPELFNDPNGIAINQTTTTINDEQISVQPNYTYEGTNCEENSCKSYTLRSLMENEADYVKTSQRS